MERPVEEVKRGIGRWSDDVLPCASALRHVDIQFCTVIDGEKLIDMLVQLELGLRPVKAYEVDGAFFKEFDG